MIGEGVGEPGLCWKDINRDNAYILSWRNYLISWAWPWCLLWSVFNVNPAPLHSESHLSNQAVGSFYKVRSLRKKDRHGWSIGSWTEVHWTGWERLCGLGPQWPVQSSGVLAAGVWASWFWWANTALRDDSFDLDEVPVAYQAQSEALGNLLLIW